MLMTENTTNNTQELSQKEKQRARDRHGIKLINKRLHLSKKLGEKLTKKRQRLCLKPGV